jgi:hypothetical protein
MKQKGEKKVIIHLRKVKKQSHIQAHRSRSGGAVSRRSFSTQHNSAASGASKRNTGMIVYVNYTFGPIVHSI